MCPEEVLVPNIETVSSIQPDLFPSAAAPLASVVPFRRRREVVGELSRRELQILELTAEGLTNAEIAKALFIGEETVKSHQRHVISKLQARSRAHAVALGFRRRLIA